MPAYRKRALAGFLLAGMAAVFIGCGSQELRTPEQASKFIDDLAHGGSASDWKLADDAVVTAGTAWLHESTIHSIGTKLREEGPEWGCHTVELVHETAKVVDPSTVSVELQPTARSIIVGQAESGGATQAEADTLIDQALDLTDSELVETISAACKTAEQL